MAPHDLVFKVTIIGLSVLSASFAYMLMLGQALAGPQVSDAIWPAVSKGQDCAHHAVARDVGNHRSVCGWLKRLSRSDAG